MKIYDKIWSYSGGYMKISLIGAELEENLGLRYIASSLMRAGHIADLVPFNFSSDIPKVVQSVKEQSPDLVCLSMVFTIRGREFCTLATALREAGYRGHINAGGPFASFNAETILNDFPAFDSIALGEGEVLVRMLAENLTSPEKVAGLCYRAKDGSIQKTAGNSNPENLDLLPFPVRTTFPVYFETPIASLLSSRGCWRNCAFCSINAWYSRLEAKKFRVRSVENIVEEMKELYHGHGVRIFNFQDDNFFLPDKDKALVRFKELRDSIHEAGMEKIAIAIKARPDSITKESVAVLKDIGLFRVFLGVENGCENGLKNLNRKQTVEDNHRALDIINDADVHVAYNYLLFEPDTTLDHIATNLLFMERHLENPFNFCRAEIHACTGLEDKLKKEGLLLGDYFRPDYRIKDRRSEIFHQIANFAFFDRNFNDDGLHYFNMQVDFYSHLLGIFHPQVQSKSLRAAARNFIRRTNLDSYMRLCQIYDFVEKVDPDDQASIREFSEELRYNVDASSKELHSEGEQIQDWLLQAFQSRSTGEKSIENPFTSEGIAGIPVLAGNMWPGLNPAYPIPYALFRNQSFQ